MFGRVEGLIGHTHDLGQVRFAVAFGQPDADRHAGGEPSAEDLLGSAGRNFDLNGEARTARTKQRCPIIPPA
jgi:hypothetical protein